MSVKGLRDTDCAVLFYPQFPEKPAQSACWVSVQISSKALGAVSMPRQGLTLIRVVSRCLLSGWERNPLS